jgi:uncharacterized protein involved in type VI secretion and phage assembly
MEFLRQRADRIGFELFVQNGKINFRKPKADKQKLTLTWLTDLHSFRVRVTSAEQVKEVEVRAWDYQLKKPMVSRKRQEQVLTKTQNGKGSDTSNKFKGKPPKPQMILNWTCFTPKEADIKAQALCDELGGQFIYADAKAEGNSDIRPGRIVTLVDMGQHSGEYYVTETRHTYHERVYMTEFSVRGLRGGNLLTALSPVNRLQPGQTFLVGIVSHNKDPKNLGRVKVKFPTLTDGHTSNWARVVAIGAGKNRGFDCVPEINDEVLVAFEQGDIHRPYVIGGVWNGKDAPPNTAANDVGANGRVRLRTFQTRVGHKIQFVEEDKGASKKGVYIETIGGHKLSINDSQRLVEIVTKGGQILRLDDKKRSISLTAKGNIDINAGGVVTIKGRIIKLN